MDDTTDVTRVMELCSGSELQLLLMLNLLQTTHSAQKQWLIMMHDVGKLELWSHGLCSLVV